MRFSAAGLISSLMIFGTSLQADSQFVQQQLTVVYAGPNTLPAQPYYRRLKTKAKSEPAMGSAPAGAGVLALGQRLPLSSTQLTVGQPAMQIVPGLVTPVFVMGMDEASLTWFTLAADGLTDIGARGVVVQASRLDHWRALQQQARSIGIDLMLMQGDALASGYGIRTYPMVLMSPELAARGAHE